METISKKTNFWERKFGHYEINWKIENFCFAFRDGSISIKAPLFYLTGRMLTRWGLLLHAFETRGEWYLKFCIRREKTEFGPHIVWTQWKLFVMHVINNEEREIDLGEFQRFFEKGDEYNSDKICLKNLLENFKAFETDVIKIRCIVLFNDQFSERSEAKESVDLGLMSLSNVLRSLLYSGKNHDLILKNNDGNIKAHRAVLYYRNEVFAQLIENHCRDNCLEFYNASREDFFSVILYLYTGDFEEFVHKPTFAKQELVQLLNVEELNNWFVLDRLYLESKYPLIESTHKCKVENFTGSSIVLTDWMRCKPFYFRIVFLPQKDDDVDMRVILFDDLTRLPKNSYFQFSLRKGRHEYTNIEELNCCPISENFFCFETYISKDTLCKSAVDGILRIRVKFKACWKSKWRTSVHFMNNEFPRTVVDHYKKLSMDMTRGMGEGKCADVVIECGNVWFNAHRCLLSARSSVLARQLKRNRLVIRNFEPRVIEILLRYIYSGVLKASQCCDILSIYCLANKYATASLLNLCSNLLRQTITEQTVADVLKFSDKYEDESLKNSALEFISRNAEEVFEEATWKSFQISNKSLNCEVRKFLESKAQTD